MFIQLCGQCEEADIANLVSIEFVLVDVNSLTSLM